MEGVVITAKRKMLIQVLRAHGPVEDEAGRATAKLQGLMELAGYPKGVSPAGFTNLLYRAQEDGLIWRDRGPNQAKLVYSISLVDDEELPRWCVHCGTEILGHPHAQYCDDHRSPKARGQQRKKPTAKVAVITREQAMKEGVWAEQELPGMPEREVEVGTHYFGDDCPGGHEVDVTEPAFDYDELARRVLAEAGRAIAKAQSVASHLRHEADLEKTIIDLKTKLASANQSIGALEQKLATAQANLTELVAERDTALKLAEEEEQGITVFKTRCQEMQDQLGQANEEIARLKGVVKRYREQEQKKGNGRGSYKLPELAGPEGMEALARIMSETPTAPESHG